MTRRYLPALIALAAATALLSACSGGAGTGTPSTSATQNNDVATSSASVGKSLPHSGAPKVDNPLPAKVLDGNPCDTALTPAELTRFLGQADSPKRTDDVLGPDCRWHNAAGNGAAISVGYVTKQHEGLSQDYQNVKPKADRWDELQPVQGYPAVGWLAAGAGGVRKSNCQVSIGISDELVYLVGLDLGDKSVAEGKDPCAAGRTVADVVLAHLKARA